MYKLVNFGVSLLLSIMLSISLLPVSSFAVATVGGTPSKPKIQDDDLNYLRQQAEEFIADDMMWMSDDYCYSQDILDEINKAYNSYMDIVMNSDNLSDFIMFDGFFTYITDDLFICSETIEFLSDFTKDVYAGPQDFDRIKKQMKADFKSLTLEIDRSAYNDYNWDIYLEKKAELSGKIDKMQKLSDFVDFMDDYSLFEYSIGTGGAQIEDVLYDDDEDMADLISIYGMFDIYSYISRDGDFYSNRVLQGAIDAGYDALFSRIKNTEFENKYKKQLNDFKKNGLKKYESADKILDFYESYDESIDEDMNVIDCDFTNSDYLRYSTMIDKYLYDHYKKSDYSDVKWREFSKIRSEYKTKLEGCKTIASADVLVNQCYAAYAKVKTLKQEIKERKAKYVKKLNSYANAKKYKQKKAKPLIKDAKAALSKCKTLKDLDSTYNKYIVKLNKTIKTFKVSVSKSGSGTVSKNKSVAYGSTYKLRITPRPGHSLNKVVINGKSQKLKYTYNIKVKKPYKIKVVFK